MLSSITKGGSYILLAAVFSASGCKSTASLKPASEVKSKYKLVQKSFSSTSDKSEAIKAPVNETPSVGVYGGKLSLETAVIKAVQWHPTIREAKAHIGQADEQINAAKAGYFPKVRAGVDSNYKRRDTDDVTPKLNVTASQTLYDFGKISSSVEIEKASRAISEAKLLQEVDSIARDTASAFIETQRYAELSTMAQMQVDGVQAIASLVAERVDQGATTESDRVQAKARVETAKTTLVQYQGEQMRWQNALSLLIGQGNTPPDKQVPGWLHDSCSISTPAWDNIPAVQLANSEKNQAKAQLAYSKANGRPTLSLEAGSSYDTKKQTGYLSTGSEQLDYSIGLNLSSTLFNGGETKARNRAAALGLTSADIAIRSTKLEVQKHLSEAQTEYRAKKLLFNSLQTRADMMAKTRDLYKEQYVELGTRTLLDLLNAEQELHEARFQIVQTRNDINRLSISCLVSSGQMRVKMRIPNSVLPANQLRRL